MSLNTFHGVVTTSPSQSLRLSRLFPVHEIFVANRCECSHHLSKLVPFASRLLCESRKAREREKGERGEREREREREKEREREREGERERERVCVCVCHDFF